MSRWLKLLGPLLFALLGTAGLILVPGFYRQASHFGGSPIWLMGVGLLVGLMMTLVRPGRQRGCAKRLARSPGVDDRLEHLRDLEWEIRETLTLGRGQADAAHRAKLQVSADSRPPSGNARCKTHPAHVPISSYLTPALSGGLNGAGAHGTNSDRRRGYGSAGFQEYRVRPVRRSPVRGLLEGALRDRGATAMSRPSKSGTGTLPADLHVLIAEDNAVNALLAQCMIGRAGASSVLVESGRAAVEAIDESMRGVGPAFDIVLMDVHMPDLDGLNAVREVRRLGRQKGRLAKDAICPPLIAVTANAYPEDRQTCIDAGFDDYLAKPFSWSDLHAVLARWLPQAQIVGTPRAEKNKVA